MADQRQARASAKLGLGSGSAPGSRLELGLVVWSMLCLGLVVWSVLCLGLVVWSMLCLGIAQGQALTPSLILTLTLTLHRGMQWDAIAYCA